MNICRSGGQRDHPGIGFSLLKESVVKAFHPTPVVFSWLSVGVLAASILVKLWMSGFNRTIGRTIGSETLMATAADSRNDVLTTGAVLVSTVVCSLTGWARLDGIMGVAVAAFILWSGWGLVMDTLSPLLGESPSPELVEHIEQTVMGYPGVLGMHDLMVHDYGPGHQSPPSTSSSRQRPTRSRPTMSSTTSRTIL